MAHGSVTDVQGYAFARSILEQLNADIPAAYTDDGWGKCSASAQYPYDVEDAS